MSKTKKKPVEAARLSDVWFEIELQMWVHGEMPTTSEPLGDGLFIRFSSPEAAAVFIEGLGNGEPDDDASRYAEEVRKDGPGIATIVRRRQS